jgi:GH25 family lysozyme M1 (1,4-beta-N-acetylmuramidase)
VAVTFHADGSSFQGNIDWHAVREAGYGGGAEKVSEGVSYVNPFWPAARDALLAIAGQQFTPGAYLFLHAGNGAGQADYFAAHAGAIPGFVIWVDLERGTTEPTVADARDCVAKLRKHYPGHQIGLYAGQSYTGSADLRFADLLWSPHYIGGSGSPAELYPHVPASWWAPYGGHTPVMVQFSQSAQVPGVAGLADVSAFRGAPSQMRAALLGTPAPAPKPAPKPATPREDAVLLNTGQGAVTPIAFRVADKLVRFFPASGDHTGLSVEFNGQPTKAVTLTGGAGSVDIPTGSLGARVIRGASGATVAVSAVVE